MKILKLSAIFLLFFLLGSCSKNSKNKTDTMKMNLNGKVRTVRYNSYHAVEKFGKVKKGRIAYEHSFEDDGYFVFNIKGNSIEESHYDSNGGLSSNFTNKYNDNGSLAEKNGYDSDGKHWVKWIHKYDSIGRESEMIRIDDDDNGKFLKYNYTYNKKGDLIEENGYYSDGKHFLKWHSKHDDKGNIIERNRYNTKGNLEQKETYKYDDKGNRIEEILYKGDGSIFWHKTYKYDNRQNKIEDVSYFDGKILSKLSYEYKFDEINNWIMVIELKNQTPQFITEREIEYFK